MVNDFSNPTHSRYLHHHQRIDVESIEIAIEIDHQRFAEEVLKDFNTRKAYQRIKPGTPDKTADTMGSRLLGKVEIQRYIAQKVKQLTEETDTHVTRALTEVRRIAFSDISALFEENGSLKPIGKWSKEVLACVASVQVEQAPGGTALITKIKLWDKNSALDKLFKYHALYKELGSKDNPFILRHIVDVRRLPSDKLGELRRATEGLLASAN